MNIRTYYSPAVAALVLGFSLVVAQAQTNIYVGTSGGITVDTRDLAPVLAWTTLSGGITVDTRDIVQPIWTALSGGITVDTRFLPPEVLTQPQDVTLIEGGPARFEVSVYSTDPVRYQWQREGVALAGLTNEFCALANVQSNQSGGYRVLAINTVGTTTSSVAVLTVLVPPTIVKQPESQAVAAGTTAAFTVGATGTAPFSYQWRFAGGNLPGGGATLTLPNVSTNQSGSYSVVVTNVAGGQTSQVASLTVVTPPVVTRQPLGRIVLRGTSLGLTVAASSQSALTCQWYRDSAKLGNDLYYSGVTTTNLNLSNAQTNHTGQYSVVLVNLAGWTTSAVVQVSVQAPMSVAIVPASVVTNAGAPVTFAAQITGSAPYALQWSKDGTALTDATNAALVLDNVQTNYSGQYQVVANNAVSAATNSASLTVVTPPVITVQPVSQAGYRGSNVTFSVTVSSQGVVAYQWQKDGAALTNGGRMSGVTGASLTVTDLQWSDVGNYAVAVTNLSGPVVSTAAVLTILRDAAHAKVPLKAELLYPTMAGRLNATAAFQAPAFLGRKV